MAGVGIHALNRLFYRLLVSRFFYLARDRLGLLSKTEMKVSETASLHSEQNLSDDK